LSRETQWHFPELFQSTEGETDMFNRHCAVSLGWMSIVTVLTWAMPTSARAQATPAYTALPQSMAPDGVPTTHPSTAGTMASGVDSPALSPSDMMFSGTAASTPSDTGSVWTPSMTGTFGASPTPYNRPDPSADPHPFAGYLNVERPLANGEPWIWQFVPAGLMYKPDLASGTECRLASQWDYVRGQGWFWNPVAGGRVGLLRYGSQDAAQPQGWQLDIAGAAFPRLDANRNMVSTDFRVAVPLTMRQGEWEFKFGYTHLSSHLGDLFMLNNPDYPRINYVRDCLAMGVAFYLNPDLRLYSESGWAFHADGGAQPWEFQFGLDFSPAGPTTTIWGSPFFAVNGHLRQENNFGGNVTVEAGVQWRGLSGHLFRVGAQYFNGTSEQGQFFQRFEEQIGLGLWYDF
jgi:hypothetical protein